MHENKTMLSSVLSRLKYKNMLTDLFLITCIITKSKLIILFCCKNVTNIVTHCFPLIVVLIFSCQNVIFSLDEILSR